MRNNIEVRFGNRQHKVDDLLGASRVFRELIEAHSFGASNLKKNDGQIYINGKLAGHVSYNGRVWDLQNKEIKLASQSKIAVHSTKKQLAPDPDFVKAFVDTILRDFDWRIKGMDKTSLARIVSAIKTKLKVTIQGDIATISCYARENNTQYTMKLPAAQTKQGDYKYNPYRTAANLMQSDNDLSMKLEPAAGVAHIPGPEAGHANDELYENSHPENGEQGSPVFDGNIKSPERQNVNAIREALETQVEMEVGKDVSQKQEEMARAEKAQDQKLMHPEGAQTVDAKPGTQIIINVGSKTAAAASPELKKKLFPGRFPQMSGKMAAILGYILDEQYTDPYITDMAVTSDGVVLAAHSDDIGMNDIVGSELALQNNWKRLCDAAGLNPKEIVEANNMFKSKITNYRVDSDEAESEPAAWSGGKPGTASTNDELRTVKTSSDKDAAFMPQRVRISDGSGIDSGKEGVVIPWADPRAEAISKDYPFVGGRSPVSMRWVAVLLDDGEVTTVPKNRAQQIKRSAEPIGGEDDSKITSGHGGGMFGGTDLNGNPPNFKQAEITSHRPMTCYILDEMGDTESAGHVNTTAEAAQWFSERGINIYKDVEAKDDGIDTTYIYKRASFHVGFVFNGWRREASFSSLKAANAFIKNASKKFKIAGEWTMKCPRCKNIMKKQNPQDDWSCQCGWNSKVGTEKPKKANRFCPKCTYTMEKRDGYYICPKCTYREGVYYKTPKKATVPVDATQKALVLEWLKTRNLTTEEIETRLGGGKYTNIAYPILHELAKEGLVKHKQMRWYLKTAKSKVADGWTNWETETVNLYITNDNKTYDMWWQMAQYAIDHKVKAERLAEHFKQSFANKERQFLREIASGIERIEPVNWIEIAQDAMDYVTNERKAKEIDTERKKVPAKTRFKNMITPEDKIRAHGLGIKAAIKPNDNPAQADARGAADDVYNKAREDASAAAWTAQSKPYPKKGTPEWHELRIAIDTLKMNPALAGVMGGPNEQEAMQTLAKYGLSWDEAEYKKTGKGLKKASMDKKLADEATAKKEAMAQILMRYGWVKQNRPASLSQTFINMKYPGYKFKILVSGSWQLDNSNIDHIWPLDYGLDGHSLDAVLFVFENRRKEAGFNLSPGGVPSQVLKEFYPEIQHEIVDYPNATNQSMSGAGNPEIVGDNSHELEGMLDNALDTGIVEMIQLPADVGDVEPMSMMGADYVPTKPAGGMGIGRDGKPEVLEGAPLRKENDIRGGMFTDEFYGQYEGIPGSAFTAAFKKAFCEIYTEPNALKTLSIKTAAGDEKKQFAEFINRVCGEIAAALCGAFKVTSRPLLDKVPGTGEVKLDQVEQLATTQFPAFAINGISGRVKYLLEKLNDGDIKEILNNAFAQSAVWSNSSDGPFVYEVFVRPETIETNSLTMKYRFICGTKENNS